ncbi:SBBP repeat-containing protein [candidate division WOR-3 bacterium]|nr:SBBP repeat-containing protein [candidate division WOR-3 bacterium]
MKKALIITILTMFVLVTSVSAEDPPTMVWDEIFGYSDVEDWGEDIAVDASGNVYVTGNTHDGVDQDWLTIKYNPNGDTMWTKTFDSGNGIDVGCGIAVDNTGNIYAVAGIPNGVDYDWTVIKYDTDGNVVWSDVQVVVGDQGAHSVVADAAGFVYVTGTNWTGGLLGYDYQTIKYDTNGDTVWCKIWGTIVNEDAWAIAVDDACNVYITGNTFNATDCDWVTIKYNSDGDTVWTRTYDSGNNDYVGVDAIAVDNMGNVYVGGCSEVAPGNRDWQIVKYDTDGNLEWTVLNSANTDECVWDIVVDSYGFIYANGDYAKATDCDCHTVKYDTDGDQVWEIIYDSGSNDHGRGVAVDDAGYVYVVGAGDAESATTAKDYLTIKYEQHTGVAEPPSSKPSSIILEVVTDLSRTPTLHYSMPGGQKGTLTFYSADGRKVDSYTLDALKSAFNWITERPSGVYFARLQAGNHSATTKFCLTK